MLEPIPHSSWYRLFEPTVEFSSKGLFTSGGGDGVKGHAPNNIAIRARRR